MNPELLTLPLSKLKVNVWSNLIKARISNRILEYKVMNVPVLHIRNNTNVWK
jgi:hypothetical protein